MSLKDQVCIITGGGSGIGRGAALRLAADGATIILIGRTESKIRTVQSEIEANGGQSIVYALNVADWSSIQKMVDEVVETYGKIDILINNAGHSSVIGDY